MYCELSIRETALATLIHQRRLTPSCGGLAPSAERTVGPARMVAESLTPRPGIREQSVRSGSRVSVASGFPPKADMSRLPIGVESIPTAGHPANGHKADRLGVTLRPGPGPSGRYREIFSVTGGLRERPDIARNAPRPEKNLRRPCATALEPSYLLSKTVATVEANCIELDGLIGTTRRCDCGQAVHLLHLARRRQPQAAGDGLRPCRREDDPIRILQDAALSILRYLRCADLDPTLRQQSVPAEIRRRIRGFVAAGL